MLSVGIDEVGRGCLAGPLVAAAVILERPIEGLKDSKLLSHAQRAVLVKQIKTKANAYGIGWVFPAEIDKFGLTKATTVAMTRALNAIKVDYDQIIIDGNLNYLKNNPKVITLIKADQTVPAVSAASILAKEARDAYMVKAAINYPEYGFEVHVGYGTKTHLKNLKQYGVSKLHRLSYKPIKALVSKSS